MYKTTSVPYHWMVLIFFLTTWACKKDSTTTTCEEHVKEDCACIKLYDPVCGCNKKTYGNACEAACAGITTYTKGACVK